MPWYYAGPEAKPIGPVSLEELHAGRAGGTIKPDTYVIEHTGQAAANGAWQRYQDLFPSGPLPLPPLPASPPVPAPPATQAHPLFPSAAPVSPPHPVFPPGAHPDQYYRVKPTNGWCAWGFGLGLAAPIVAAMTCGIGGLLAFPALLFCIVGLAHVHRKPEQAGQGLAIAGLVLSVLAVVIALAFIVWVDIPMIKAHGVTVTEQTSNDSESCGRQYF